MKTAKMNFGFNAVSAGQRGTVTVPELIAVSTRGGFRITPEVARYLGLQSGDYIAFVKNTDAIDTEVLQKGEVFTSFCAERGLDINEPTSAIAFHREYDLWGLIKGYPVYDKSGNPVMVTERLSSADKAFAVNAHYDEYLAAAKANGEPELVAAIEAAGDDKKAISDILMAIVTGDTVQKVEGSKLASPSGMTGPTTLSFTDSNVWAQLKSGLSMEDASKISRRFAINLDEGEKVTIFNGRENIDVPCLFFDAYSYTEKETSRNASTDVAE